MSVCGAVMLRFSSIANPGWRHGPSAARTEQRRCLRPKHTSDCCHVYLITDDCLLRTEHQKSSLMILMTVSLFIPCSSFHPDFWSHILHPSLLPSIPASATFLPFSPTWHSGDRLQKPSPRQHIMVRGSCQEEEGNAPNACGGGGEEWSDRQILFSAALTLCMLVMSKDNRFKPIRSWKK